ncbi:putative Gti1/Pac2-like cAMP-independent regulatory protein [Hamiltosporidium magnivora]|uniref:Putative Gti1/Pac2-like cAMP-independent regulatory protein n=1 Tax=Hamiltosporidium magnivora TaxID=148818 RepID=A0A4Q9L8G4_9MICR|nr:putative Gti1/Pac2-like cAMP-independent regulatory protein [Hamiltosporidium magnivora]
MNSTIETFYGCLHTQSDCQKLILLCQYGHLGRIIRRLSSYERASIRCGSIFVYEESESNIFRWTDGRAWHPSRLRGCFIFYKEKGGKLLKKTLNMNIAGKKYHVVAYQNDEDDQKRICCQKYKTKISTFFNQYEHMFNNLKYASTEQENISNSNVSSINMPELFDFGKQDASFNEKINENSFLNSEESKNNSLNTLNEIKCSDLNIGNNNSINKNYVSSSLEPLSEKNEKICKMCDQKIFDKLKNPFTQKLNSNNLINDNFDSKNYKNVYKSYFREHGIPKEIPSSNYYQPSPHLRQNEHFKKNISFSPNQQNEMQHGNIPVPSYPYNNRSTTIPYNASNYKYFKNSPFSDPISRFYNPYIDMSHKNTLNENTMPHFIQKIPNNYFKIRKKQEMEFNNKNLVSYPYDITTENNIEYFNNRNTSNTPTNEETLKNEDLKNANDLNIQSNLENETFDMF